MISFKKYLNNKMKINSHKDNSQNNQIQTMVFNGKIKLI